VGQYSRLGQGRTARHFSDIQLDGAVYRPVLAGCGRIGRTAGDLFRAARLPATILGSWLGARLYHALSDRNFRDVVLGLLFLSGAGLVWSVVGAP